MTSHVAQFGFICGRVIDLSFSPHYNLVHPRAVEWIMYLLHSRKLRCLMLAPPCTTFSAAAQPSVQSYDKPEGFCRTNEKTRLGNRLAFMSLAIFLVAIVGEPAFQDGQDPGLALLEVLARCG